MLNNRKNLFHDFATEIKDSHDQSTKKQKSHSGITTQLNKSKNNCFDSSFQNFIVITNDNRPKVFSVSNGKISQQLTETRNLSSTFTCATFGNDCISTNALDSLVALGTKGGQIVVWDLLKGEIKYRWGQNEGSHYSQVNDIVFNKSGSEMFSCSEDKTIKHWDMKNGKLISTLRKDKQEIYRMCIHPDDTILAYASTSIKLIDLSSKKTIKKFPGHSHAISSLNFSSNGSYLGSCSEDRLISLWECSSNSKDSSAPMATFAGTHNPISIGINSHINEKYIHLIALTEDKTINIWSANANERQSTALKPLSTVNSSDVFSVMFCSETEIILARGNPSSPVFEKIKYISNGTFRKLHLSSLTAKLEISSIKQNQKKAEKATAKPSVLSVEHHSQPNTSIKVESMKEILATEMSFKEKIEAMSIGNEEKEKMKKHPRPDSVTNTLSQALHSKDKRLLDSCLRITEKRVIHNTVHQLSGEQIMQLLNYIVASIQSNPNYSRPILFWIQAIFKIHASYLMTSPNLIKSLSTLYVVFDSRVHTYKKLLKLKGRLDLVRFQIVEQEKKQERASTIYEESSDEEIQESEMQEKKMDGELDDENKEEEQEDENHEEDIENNESEAEEEDDNESSDDMEED